MRKKTGSEVFGRHLKGYRKKNNLTGEKLAKLSGVDRTHISKIEHGVHAPDFLIVERMARALNEPGLITLYLLQNHQNIDKYYRKKYGPDSLTKTVLIDLLHGASDKEILISFNKTKNISASKQNEKIFLELIHQLRKIHQEFEKFTQTIGPRPPPE